MKYKSRSITDLARELRNNPTPAENKLWKLLRKKHLGDYRFLRQKPIIYEHRKEGAYFFIADFYCSEQKLVIELDGPYHQKQKEYDKNRDLVINRLGIQVLRIKNKELDDMEGVEKKIMSWLE